MKLSVKDVDVDEELVLSRRKQRREKKPSFIMFGDGKTNKVGTSMDVVDVLLSLSPASAKLFKVMLRKRNVDTNHVVLRPGDVDSPRIITNHMPSLIEKEIVKRMGNCHYMINPYLVIPNNYRSSSLEWRGIKTTS